ncbi:MFS transporter [Streptomyces sp. NPDC060035]|uniref:MFS transporter n=1 Tax=Streptomyces sp. NPDC060035 TaxID=3347044 RepID=UPI0036B0AE5A
MSRSKEVTGDFTSEEADGIVRPARPVPLIIAVLLFADIVSSLESTMLVTALPRIITTFHTTPADASWVLTAFALVAAASAAVCGRLGDIYGRRNLIITLLLISAVGSIVSISTGTLTGVIIGRAIQGVSGGILPLCFGLARESLPKKQVPVAIAWIAGAALLGGASGALVSGALIDTLGWRYIFITTVVVAVLSAAACPLLPRSTVLAKVERIDWLGGVLFAPAIALVLFGITKSGTWTWQDGRTIGTILAGVLLLAVWAWWELRVDSPMINIRLFANRKLALTTIATMAIAIGPLGITGFLLHIIKQSPTSAPVGLGLSASVSGALAFGTAIIGFLLAPVSGRISARTGSRRALMIGSVLGVINALALVLLHNSLVGVIISSVFLTMATSFMLSSTPNLVVECVPAENTSEATGVNTVARTAFAGVGTSVGTLVLSTSLVPGTQFSTESAFLQVFAIMGGCCVVALIAALLIRPAPRTTTDTSPALEPQAV